MIWLTKISKVALVPNQMRYQTAPHSDARSLLESAGDWKPLRAKSSRRTYREYAAVSGIKSRGKPRNGRQRRAFSCVLATVLLAGPACAQCSKRSIDQPKPAIHKEAPCPQNAERFLVLGQSNSTNFAWTFNKASSPNVYVQYEGKCYNAADPMPGGMGGKGSPWPLFGDLRTAQTGRPVVMITRGVGGSSAREWLTCRYLRRAMPDLKKPIDHILWVQGEADNGRLDHYGSYVRPLTNLYKRAKALAPGKPKFWIARASLIAGRIDPVVTNAQTYTCLRYRWAGCGPDIDLFTDRYDNTHYSAETTKRVAEAWAEVLR